LFWWTGKIETAEEYVLLMKSRENLFDELSERVRALHSYDIPEIIALPVVRGYKTYAEWLDNYLK
ncbi:MAG: divalent-cation tolerance protein CutA, partial [Candidatus Bathyarchaeia archaeon]